MDTLSDKENGTEDDQNITKNEKHIKRNRIS